MFAFSCARKRHLNFFLFHFLSPHARALPKATIDEDTKKTKKHSKALFYARFGMENIKSATHSQLAKGKSRLAWISLHRNEKKGKRSRVSTHFSAIELPLPFWCRFNRIEINKNCFTYQNLIELQLKNMFNSLKCWQFIKQSKNEKSFLRKALKALIDDMR